MKYSPAQLLALLRTPLGRSEIGVGLRYRAWPIFAAAARRHRRRLGTGTRFVAVVGSFGKTTTARAVRAALGLDPQAHVASNAWTAVARRILATRPGERHAVIEAGINGPGQMVHYAALVRPDVTVVTAVGSEHNRSLGTLEGTRDEKAAMVRGLAPDGVAVLNGDDPNVRWMATQTRARVVTFGLGEDNAVIGRDVRLDWPHGLVLDVEVAGTVTANGRAEATRVRRTVRAPLLGEKMAYPLLAAMAVGMVEGRDLDQVARDLATVATPPGRLQPVTLPNGVVLLRDEYKSPLETVHAALDVLEQVPARRKIVVLGDVAEPVGPQGPIYREIGARVARIATHAVLVGIQHQPLATGAVRAGMARDAIFDARRSVARATEHLRRILEPGDVVLIKGRDTEKLDRISLALAGREVRCAVVLCGAKKRCAVCPMLARDWSGLGIWS